MKRETVEKITAHEASFVRNAWVATPPREEASQELVVNVIYTGETETLAALRSAARFAARLGARVCLDVLHVVPFPRELDDPQVQLPALRARYSNLVAAADVEAEVHIFLCRSSREAAKQLFAKPSIVVLGGKERPWPTRESRLGKLFEKLGHKVLFVTN